MPFFPHYLPPPTATLLSFAFHWQSQPCHGETVSGDGLFLEIGRIGDQEYLLLLVDVMGHGPPSAAIVDHLRNVLLPDPECWNLGPAQLLTLLNTWLGQVWDEQGLFVAAQAILVRADGTLVGSNGGIPDPRRRSGAAGSLVWNLRGGTMLGPILPQIYAEDMLSLAPGEGVLAFTDGVSEAGNPQFGNALLDAFLTTDALGPGLVARLFVALRQHMQSGWPADDTTAFWLERQVGAEA
jgi:serine phosphatase RsbU (regulator of sigma subunit)